MMDIPLKGNIRYTGLPKILASLNRTRKTGTLVVKTPVFTKKVYLMKGDAIFASSTYEDDRLGEMLIKAGKITMEQLDESVSLLKKTGKRQGAILVELGYLTPKDLFWGVKYQVKEIIHSLFQLQDAEYDFIGGEIPADEVITLTMSMGNLIYEGAKRIDNWTRIRNEMPPSDTVFKLSNDPVALFQDVELSPQDRKMLSLIDGAKTIKELIDNAWVGSFEGMKTVYVLWSIGVVEEKRTVSEEAGEAEETISLEEILAPVSEDEYAFIRKVDEIYTNLDMLSPVRLLELNEGFDEETVKKNYYRLTREFHPDRYFNSADPSLKDKLTAIFDKLTDAYNQLQASGEPGRERATTTVTCTEDHFNRAVGEFKKGNFPGAVDAFTSATLLEPGNAKFWSYLSLSYSKIPGRLKDAEAALSKAIGLEPDNADHYANLGLIYLRQDRKQIAQEMFENALKLNPENEKAKKGLEKIKG